MVKLCQFSLLFALMIGPTNANTLIYLKTIWQIKFQL